MAIARKRLIDDRRSGTYHVISRCVRRAFLCGDAGEHRRDRVARLVEEASRLFAIEILGFAIMSNHFHLVLKNQPAWAASWSDRVVAERWAALHPQAGPGDIPEPWSEEQIARLASDPLRCHVLRQRLASISWMMKHIKERVARRANREDGCTGHFWEQRFTSVKLLDQAALLSCLCYVDLNPIRARMADRPETSTYTSVRERIRARQAHLIAKGLTGTDAAAEPVPSLRTAARKHPEQGLWIAAMERCLPGDPDAWDAPRPVRLDDYLELVEATGRIIRGDKRGHIPQHLTPILQRLDLDARSWIDLMRSHGRFLGTAIGHYAARAREAARRGMHWICNTLPGVFSGRPPDPAST